MYLVGGVSEKEPHLDLHQPHLVKNTHQNKLYKTIDTTDRTCNSNHMITYQEVEQAEESYLVASVACELDQTEENELALDAAYEAYLNLIQDYRFQQTVRYNRPDSTLTPEKIKRIFVDTEID